MSNAPKMPSGISKLLSYSGADVVIFTPVWSFYRWAVSSNVEQSSLYNGQLIRNLDIFLSVPLAHKHIDVDSAGRAGAVPGVVIRISLICNLHLAAPHLAAVHKTARNVINPNLN